MTTGLGTSVYEALDYDGGVRSIAIEDLHAAITAATRGNVTIYPLDPSGARAWAATSPSRCVPDSDNPMTGGLADHDRTDAGSAQARRSHGRVRHRRHQQLRGRVFAAWCGTTASYYVLGFSTDHQQHGRALPHGPDSREATRSRRCGRAAATWRRCAGRRRSSRAPSTLAPAVTDALQSPIAVSGVPIRLFAAPYKGTDQQARVAIAAEFGVDSTEPGAETGPARRRSRASRCGRRPPMGSSWRDNVTSCRWR